MSAVAELISKIRGKRQEKFQSTAEQYERFITKLAKGEQVDLEAVAEVLDLMDKSDSDLAKDIDAKSQRLAADERIAELQKLESTLPKLRAENERAQAELKEAIDRLRPIANAAERALFDAENQVSNIAYQQGILRSVGVPAAIQDRQEKLKEVQQQRRAKRETYEHRTEHKKYLPQYRQHLKDAEKALASTRADEPGNRRHAQEQLDKAKAEVDRIEAILETWAPLKAELDALDRQISAEQREIDKLLMQP